MSFPNLLYPQDPFEHPLNLADARSLTPDFGSNWDEREAIAERTGGLDFNCRFQSGVCKKARALRGVHTTNTRYCCEQCAMGNGWLAAIRPSALPAILELFDGRLGFWREGVGCTLPRKWRSYGCLTYNCSSQPKELEEQFIQIGFPPSGRV